MRLINRAEPEGKSRITLEIKLAAAVIKAATTLISTRIGTNRTDGGPPSVPSSAIEGYRALVLHPFLSRESVNHANTVAGAAGKSLSGSLVGSSHVLHKVMTRTFLFFELADSTYSVRARTEREIEKERGELPTRSHALGIFEEKNQWE